MVKDDIQAFIDRFTELLNLSRESGDKGYEFFIRDLLTHLYKDDLIRFTEDIKYCNPRNWHLNGLSNSEDKKTLSRNLVTVENLMKKNNIPLGRWFFQNSNQLSTRLKEFD